MRRFVAFFVLCLLLAPAIPLSADAAATYKAKCAACHAQDGSGDTVMGKKMGVRSLSSSEVQKQSDAALVEVIAKGKGKMPGYDGKIPAGEIKGLVALIRSFATK